ncbi:hypothetical protein U1Q18_045812 [Sarracenia purpurea var. burkii]
MRVEWAEQVSDALDVHEVYAGLGDKVVAQKILEDRKAGNDMQVDSDPLHGGLSSMGILRGSSTVLA